MAFGHITALGSMHVMAFDHIMAFGHIALLEIKHWFSAACGKRSELILITPVSHQCFMMASWLMNHGHI